jgi:hypothetical protein
MNKVTSEKLATTDFDLPDMEGSTWLVRHQETTIGNLISDAFRTIFDCQIGLINGSAPECHIHALYDRLLLNRGGMYKTLANCKLVSMEPRISRDALRDYLKDTLKGVVPERYKNVEGRITIVND